MAAGRTVSGTVAGLVVALAAVAGAGSGAVARHVARGGKPERAGASAHTRPSASPTAGPSTRPHADLLGADQTLSSGDFSSIGWPAGSVRRDILTTSDPQELFPCQRQPLTRIVGNLEQLYVTWKRGDLTQAEELVLRTGSIPQAQELVARLRAWHADCQERAVKLMNVGVPAGSAAAWSVPLDPQAPDHSVVVRTGDVVGWVRLAGTSGEDQPSAAELRALAIATAARLQSARDG